MGMSCHGILSYSILIHFRCRQFYDLLELFKTSGKPPDTNYLFLGGYVGFGHFSIETMSLLICLMIRYPSRVHLLRGSHECRAISEIYGLYSESIRKYGNVNVWKYLCDLFDYLPIAAIVNNSLYCVHGGLSPTIYSMDNITALNRFQDIPSEGSFCDMMWSDPNPDEMGFKPNSQGAGFLFGVDTVGKFLRTNGLDHMIRSHSLCFDGYQVRNLAILCAQSILMLTRSCLIINFQPFGVPPTLPAECITWLASWK